MTQMKQDKRYNYTGTVSNVVVRKDKNDAEWVSFDLARATGKPVKCVAFTAKAAQFLAQFAEGATAKVFGFYEKRAWKSADGQERTGQHLKVIWSGLPRTGSAAGAEPTADGVPESTEVMQVLEPTSEPADPASSPDDALVAAPETAAQPSEEQAPKRKRTRAKASAPVADAVEAPKAKRTRKAKAADDVAAVAETPKPKRSRKKAAAAD